MDGIRKNLANFAVPTRETKNIARDVRRYVEAYSQCKNQKPAEIQLFQAQIDKLISVINRADSCDIARPVDLHWDGIPIRPAGYG